jgi:hypothetical protein
MRIVQLVVIFHRGNCVLSNIITKEHCITNQIKYYRDVSFKKRDVVKFKNVSLHFVLKPKPVSQRFRFLFFTELKKSMYAILN